MTTSASELSTSPKELLRRLRAGQRWLTEQHRLWLDDDSHPAHGDKFSAALAARDQLERVFRCSGYKECIWGPSGHCPEDAPLICDGCVNNRRLSPRSRIVYRSEVLTAVPEIQAPTLDV